MLVDKKRPGRRPAPMNLTSYSQLIANAELEQQAAAGTRQREMSPAPEEAAAEDGCTLRKGVLWYCRDTLLSRWNWKERYFVLTRDYLSCFKKTKSQYSDMGAFLFKLPLASLTGVEWQRLRGQAAVAICDPREGRLLIRATQDVLDQWYKALKQAAECSRERRRYLRLSSSNLSALGLGAAGAGGRASLSDSSPAIDRLCERVEREVWGAGSGGRLMRRQKSELDAGVVLRRQLHYASQKRLNRHSMMPEIDLYDPKHRPTNVVISRSNIIRRHNDSLDSAGHSPSTTPSKSSVSSSEGSAVHLRAGAGGASISRGSAIDDVTIGQRTSSVRRRCRGRTPAGVHGDQIRPQSMVCDVTMEPTEVILRKKDRTTQLRQEYRAQNRRSCDVTLLNRRSAYLAHYDH